MNSKERVKAVIDGKPFDRIPLYGWVRENLNEQISEFFGSVETFEDKYEFDYAHIFGGPLTISYEALDDARKQKSELLPSDILQMLMNDADDSTSWKDVKKRIDFYGIDRERFTYMQTPGIFEQVNEYFGIENHLMYMVLYPQDMLRLYEKQSDWNVKFAMNAIDLNIDMVHISDDWGAQGSLLFNPQLWHDMIAPNHKKVVDAVHKRGVYASLHSDGHIDQVLDGMADIGYDAVHPYQASAGMGYDKYLKKYSKNFAIIGGLDIQETLGFGRLDDVKKEIEFILEKFKDRGLLLCTTHYVQDHCSMEELTFAYDLVYESIRK